MPFLSRPLACALATAVGLLAGAPARAQQADSLAAIVPLFRQYSQRTLVEQLFLHLDRPAYAAGETMWFKAYAVDGTYHRPLRLSRVAYVEVLDAQNRPVAQAQLALHEATGQGSLVLPTTLASGRYVVRAYTGWMQNFGPDFYFQSPVVIVNTFSPSGAGPAAARAGYDVQFFPEGGQLVQGLPGRVAFKLLDAAGHSLDASGTVADAHGKVVAAFQTLKFGLGSFSFTPAEAGAGYVATVKLPGGATVTGRLPAVQAQGYTLRLQETSSTVLRLTVQTTLPGPDGRRVQLVGHAGEQVAVALAAPLQAGQAFFLLNKRDLPEGITHFTVFDGARRPVAERLYFQAPRRSLALAVQADKAVYGPRERVDLQLTASSAANLSLAVYQFDSLSAAGPADIGGYLLLAAGLKGFIENPGYYVRDSSAAGRAAADNLMLTQGWSRFRWNDVLAGSPPPLAHLAEANGPLLRVRLTTAAGAPAPGVGAYLSIPGRTGRFYYARSRPDGVALFEPVGFVGLQKLVLQTDPQAGGPYELRLLSPYSDQFASARPAGWAATPALAPALLQRHLQVQVAQAFGEPARYRVPAPDSVSLYGNGEQYRLDDYTRFKVMEEVMREYVPGVLVRKRKDGFHFQNLNRPRQLIFQDDPLVLLDGVPIFHTDEIMAFDPLKVKQLNVVTSRYFQGSQTYDGVVSYTTYKGDLADFPLDPHALLEEYEGVQGQREFYAPRYETAQQQQSRLPDLRNLLYWNPQLTTQPAQRQALNFYTSDQAGRYVVVVQGLAADGRPGAALATFEVKPAL